MCILTVLTVIFISNFCHVRLSLDNNKLLILAEVFMAALFLWSTV